MRRTYCVLRITGNAMAVFDAPVLTTLYGIRNTETGGFLC